MERYLRSLRNEMIKNVQGMGLVINACIIHDYKLGLIEEQRNQEIQEAEENITEFDECMIIVRRRLENL